MSKVPVYKVSLTADERFTLVEIVRAAPAKESGLAHAHHLVALERVLRYDDALDEVHAGEMTHARLLKEWRDALGRGEEAGPRPRPMQPEQMVEAPFRLPGASALFARAAVEGLRQQPNGHNAIVRVARKLRCKLAGKGFDFELADGGGLPDGIEFEEADAVEPGAALRAV